MKTLPTLLKPLPMFARAKACLSLLPLSSKPRVCWRRWQNSDTWTANWALSMLVSLSQSLTQWEGTQHANSALVNSCLCVSGKILTLGRRIGHSPCRGCVPAITLHRRLAPAVRPIVFPSNNCKKQASAGCRVNFFGRKLFVEMSRQMLERSCKCKGENCLWKFQVNHTQFRFPRRDPQVKVFLPKLIF